jgi:1,4-dihydroxy-2-naphthoate octaprenyltransferase
MSQLTAWLHAIRPRTLPLALSSTIAGSFMAAADKRFSLSVFLLASATTLLLQILSNLANDYGDFTKGTDGGDRLGPKRMVQSGLIKPRPMVLAISLVVIMTLFSGISLILAGTQGAGDPVKIIFLLVGIGAILAAVKYTVGRSPYGYHGLGDLFVFIFFGLVGVIGTYYLHTGQWKPDLILPAASIGFLSAGVLNLNNMRDYHSDKLALKKTLVVMMGSEKAKFYHLLLITGAMVTVILYTLMNLKSGYQFLFLIPVPVFIQDIITVFKNRQPAELNGELRKLALSTLVFSIAFGVGLMF